jgi:hypothetical protein
LEAAGGVPAAPAAATRAPDWLDESLIHLKTSMPAVVATTSYWQDDTTGLTLRRAQRAEHKAFLEAFEDHSRLRIRLGDTKLTDAYGGAVIRYHEAALLTRERFTRKGLRTATSRAKLAFGAEESFRKEAHLLVRSQLPE